MSDGRQNFETRLEELGRTPLIAALAHEHAGENRELARVIRVEFDRVIAATEERDRNAFARELPAVGDWVVLNTETEDAHVVDVLERSSALVRFNPGTGSPQTLATNVDVVLICASLDRELNTSRLQREVVLGWEAGSTPVIVLTKSDATAEAIEAAEEVRRLILGVDVLVTSSLERKGVERVRALLQPNRTAVLIGPSGAGKSTLFNALVQADQQAVGRVREGDNKGRHTTTTRNLFPVPGGGILIDTPGLRAVGLWDASVGLAEAFADIVALAESCRFRDCAHRAEPGCAVRRAIEAGELEPQRFSEFMKLSDEVAATDEHASAQAKAEEKRLNAVSAKALRASYKIEDKGRGR